MPSIRRRQALIAASAAATGLAGCTAARERVGDVLRDPPERRVAPDWRPGPGTWAEPDYGPAKRRHNPHATPPRTDPVVDWRRDLDGPPGDGSLVVADDTVYLATRRRLLALDAPDGALRWEHGFDGPAGLKFVDGRLYQVNWGLRESELVARSPGGEERWRTDVPDQIKDVHEQDGYVFVAGRSRYYTLHADTGVVVRERDDWVRTMASAGDGIYAAFSDFLVRYAVDGRTLEERWRAQSDYPSLSRDPVVAEDRIYVPKHDVVGASDAVLVYDPSGEQRGRIELERSPLRLAIAEDGLVVVSPSSGDGGSLLAIRPDGSRRWTADVGGRAGAIAAAGTVYAGNPLVALDTESGERLWKRDVVGGAVRLAAADSTLYVATPDGLLAFRE